MTGGLLNLVSEGNQNVFLTGNPSKTFFKAVYKKYTNFGLQRLRIDYDGQRYLSMEQETLFSFKVPRYAELLMDTYLVITLPDIWSPVYIILIKLVPMKKMEQLNIVVYLMSLNGLKILEHK